MVPPVPALDPQVSVIVPARNEEVSLPACLGSLVAQAEVSFEIILVDPQHKAIRRDPPKKPKSSSDTSSNCTAGLIP